MNDNEMADLPPRPDPSTGRPRPPRAPLYGKSDASDHDPNASLPKPPDGCGPTLEAYVVSNRSAWYGGLFVVGFFLVVFTLVYGFDWMNDWVMWVITLGVPVLLVWAIRGTFCAAGADWLGSQKGWVQTYELDEIKMHLHGNSIDLALKDSSGRRSSNKIADLQANQDLWDLVYNGIRHSAAGGAEINNYARGALHLGGAKKER